MMIITRSVRLVFLAYLLALSANDIKYKRVDNRFLTLILPTVTADCVIRTLSAVNTGKEITSIALGSGTAFAVFLGAAMVTHGGIGGGDIKLASIMGAVLGFEKILVMMFTASILALLYGLIKRMITKSKHNDKFRIAFVPFMTAGYAACLLADFI